MIRLQMNKLDVGSLLAELPKTTAQLQTVVDNIDPALWVSLANITPDTVIQKHQQKALTAVLRKHCQVSYTNKLNAEEMNVYLST